MKTQILLYLTWSMALPMFAQAIKPCELMGSVSLASIDWMSGHWVTEKDGTTSEEWWVSAKGELMLGMHRSVKLGKRTFFEYLRIERSEVGITYYASPLGRPATAFKLTDCGSNWVVFENNSHDWPTKITYRLLDKETLVAQAEGGKGEHHRVATWRYWRVSPTD